MRIQSAKVAYIRGYGRGSREKDLQDPRKSIRSQFKSFEAYEKLEHKGENCSISCGKCGDRLETFS